MAGIGDLLMQSMNWRLSSQDDSKVVEGQYVPTDLEHNVSANYAEIGTLGRSQPIIQYENDELESITFSARVWARSQDVKIEALMGEILALPRKDPDLGRPRIWEFSVGESLAMVCVVKSVGGVRYDRMRPFDGSHRGATFRITLWRYEIYDVSLSGNAAESLVLPFKDNEGFESLARRVYGDPKLGEPLRRRNPSAVVPVAGTLIHLPPKASLTLGFALEPVSIPLASTSRQASAKREHFSRRARTHRSHILGSNWTGA